MDKAHLESMIMARIILVGVLLGLSFSAFGHNTVYETTDKQGTPSFSDTMPENGQEVKTLTLEELPPPTSPSPDTIDRQQNLMNQDQQLDESLHQQASNLDNLKQNMHNAQANLEQAEDNLAQAQEAMNSGNYRIGNDQFIDQDYIRDLQRSVDTAKQQLAVATEKYDHARQQK